MQEVEEDVEDEDEDPEEEEENEEDDEGNDNGGEDEDDGGQMRMNMGSDGERDELDELPYPRGNRWKGPISRKPSQTSVYLQEWDIPFEQLDLGELIGKVRDQSCLLSASNPEQKTLFLTGFKSRAGGAECTRVGGTVKSPFDFLRLTETTKTI